MQIRRMSHQTYRQGCQALLKAKYYARVNVGTACKDVRKCPIKHINKIVKPCSKAKYYARVNVGTACKDVRKCPCQALVRLSTARG